MKNALKIWPKMLTIYQTRRPIGKELIKKLRPNGLKITKVSVPLGVIAVIFESRPNVACDVACDKIW